MLRNVWKKSSLEWDTTQSPLKVDSSNESNLNLTKADRKKNVSGTVNRDSGIFEDFSSPPSSVEEDDDYFLPGIDLNEKDKVDYLQPDLISEEDKDQEDYLQPGAFFTEEDKADYLIHETDPGSDYEGNSTDENLSSSCDTDRELHASLSSLDTEVASTSLSISLSSLITSTDEEEEGASDFDLSSSDSEELSDESSVEDQDNSNSFGYHSLLNDLSPDGDVNSDFDLQELKDSKNDDQLLDAEVSSLTNFADKNHALAVTSVSPALSFYDNHPFGSHSQCGIDSSCSSSLRSFDSSSSNDTTTSEDENPSDIEFKMAETEVKMCDALLSSGREDLALRSKIHLKNTDILMDTMSLKRQIHTNDFKPPNNNLNEDYEQYPVDDNEASTDRSDMNLPLESNTRLNSSWRDNRYSSSSIESPIVDAYEKECRDAPEKMVKEFENKEKELENKQRVLKDKQQELENELQELENKQQALFDKKKQESEERIAEALTEMNIEHDQDLLAFEAVMKAAIKNKEESNVTPLMNIDLIDDIGLRHRPSPQQRRRDRNALRRNLLSQIPGSNGVGSPEAGEFDVYNMETALPTIDWAAMEELFRASQEEDEKRRRTDREEIRKKLAMETDDDEDIRNNKKPSLHSRIQNGKNLQICFMNETASDCESQCSDTESTEDRPEDQDSSKKSKVKEPKDFLSHQARLQEDARMALAQAKEMARMQMHLEKQSLNKSPIAEIVRGSFNKIGFPCPDNKRRMSRQVLSDMNVAQLQVIVNEFHTQIENLNEVLVQLLLQRDDLHMEQDSMLVDIEDLNKHLGAKEGCILLKHENKTAKSGKRFPKPLKSRPLINK